MSLIAFTLAALAQAAPPPLPPKPPVVDCNDANHRAFDFWIGEWDVSRTGTNLVVARSRIEKLAGCAIGETFEQSIGPGGKPSNYQGRSISSYVPGDANGRQFYIDSQDAAQSFTGVVVDGAMVLTATYGPVTTRMTVRPNADGSVRQSGEISTDGGKSWGPGYDFTYRKR